MSTSRQRRRRIIKALRGGIAGLVAALTGLGASPAGQASDEARLRFLPEPPQEPVYHHHNVVRLDADSAASGWARLEQCHENFDAANLDRVPRAQIVYHKERIRNLTVESYRDIAEARVEDASVQLSRIGRDARLCVTADSRMLHDEGDGTYTLRNGPFMRRFLDGYYDMHVSMDVHLPGSGWRLVRTSPPEQPGFRVRTTSNTVHLNAWFSGRLETRLRLRAPRDE